MLRLTPDERRRVFQARQSAAREVRAPLGTASTPVEEPHASASRLRKVAAIGLIVMCWVGAGSSLSR
jgi:hypothetical protein